MSYDLGPGGSVFLKSVARFLDHGGLLEDLTPVIDAMTGTVVHTVADAWNSGKQFGEDQESKRYKSHSEIP